MQISNDVIGFKKNMCLSSHGTFSVLTKLVQSRSIAIELNKCTLIVSVVKPNKFDQYYAIELTFATQISSDIMALNNTHPFSQL